MKSYFSARSAWPMLATGIVVALSGHGLLAQDPAKAVPQFYKVLQDNPQVRVLEIHLPPGQKSPMHSHPNYVIYNFSPCKVRFTAPDGQTTELEFKAGQTAFRPAESHSVENIGTTEAHVLNIELKQPSQALAQEHRTFQPTDLQWQPGPEGLPAGGQMTVLSGNPAQPGPFVVRFKTPGGYKILPHWHSADEQITIISGSLNMGMGDTFDESKGQPLGPGGFSSMPARMHHFAWSREPTVIQINSVGPFDIHYLNPADDPRQHLTPTGRTPQ